jgi:hypothetical protein
MHVDATNFGDRLAGRSDFADRMHELARALPGRSTEQLAITDGCAVACGERRLVVRELVGVGIVVELVERSTMTLTHAGESLVCPAGDVGDLLGACSYRGSAQRYETEPAKLGSSSSPML